MNKLKAKKIHKQIVKEKTDEGIIHEKQRNQPVQTINLQNEVISKVLDVQYVPMMMHEPVHLIYLNFVENNLTLGIMRAFCRNNFHIKLFSLILYN